LYRANGLTAGLKHLEGSTVRGSDYGLLACGFVWFSIKTTAFRSKELLETSGQNNFYVIHFWSFMVLSRLVACLERKAIKYTN
jgi:hypothetical protein